MNRTGHDFAGQLLEIFQAEAKRYHTRTSSNTIRPHRSNSHTAGEKLREQYE
jgi:hypothetical protein